MYFLIGLFSYDIYMLLQIHNKIPEDDALFLTALLSLINVNMAAVYIYFHRNVFVFFFFLYHLKSLSLSVLNTIRKTPYTEDILAFFYDRNELYRVYPHMVEKAGIFIFQAEVMLIVYLLILPSFKPMPLNWKRVTFLSEKDAQYVMLVVLLIAFGSKFYLMAIGAWDATGDKSEANLSPLTDTFKELSRFDIVAYLIFGYYKQYKKDTPLMNILYITTLPFAIVVNMTSGSKAEVAKVAIVIIYNKFFYSTKKDIIITLAIMGTLGSILFPYNSYMKLHKKEMGGFIPVTEDFIKKYLAGDIKEKTETYIPNNDDQAKRTDYFTITALAVEHYPEYPEQLDWRYKLNFIGLIPRAIWPNKPLMATGTHEVGFVLGILQEDDTSTSVGLGPIAEGWRFFGYYAIFITPLFMAILIKFFAEMFDQSLLYGRVIHYYVGLEFARNDSLALIVPGSLKPVILIGITLLFVNYVFPPGKDKKT